MNHIIEKFSSVPEGFNLHRGLERTLKGRKQMQADDSVDWSVLDQHLALLLRAPLCFLPTWITVLVTK